MAEDSNLDINMGGHSLHPCNDGPIVGRYPVSSDAIGVQTNRNNLATNNLNGGRATTGEA